MTNTARICLALFSLAFTSYVNADEKPKSDSPSAALLSYYEALKKGDLDAAKSLTANFAKLPAEYVSQYTSKYSEGAKADKLTIKLVPKSSKVSERCCNVRGRKQREASLRSRIPYQAGREMEGVPQAH
ncbi:MAG: hypothetical protein AAF065_09055 [Verrucomicrobiota bacterium]